MTMKIIALAWNVNLTRYPDVPADQIDQTEPEAAVSRAGFPLWGIAAIVVALALMAVLALALAEAGRGRPKVGDEAPDFTLEILDGDLITLSDLRGKVVLVNFWASWCDPCKDEAPGLEMLWQAYKDEGAVFIGIDWSDSELSARKYLKDFGVTYPNGRDLGQHIADSYRLDGVPETYLIDKDGIVDWFHLGPITDFPALSDRIQWLLDA